MADVSIYQNYLKPPKSVEDYDAAALQQRQNLLGLQENQLKIKSAMQAQADEAIARQRLIESGGDVGKALPGILGAGAIGPGMKLGEALDKQKLNASNIGLHDANAARYKAQTGQIAADQIEKQRRAAFEELITAPNPEAARALLYRRAKEGSLSEELYLSAINRIPHNPEEFNALKEQTRAALVGAEKSLPKVETTALGDISRRQIVSPITGQPMGAPVDTRMGVPPATRATLDALAPTRAAQVARDLVGAQTDAARTNYETGANINVPGVSSMGAPAVPAPAGRTGTTTDLNNPGGLRPVGKSTGFQSFGSPEEGVAAVTNNLKAYGRQGINTIERIVSTWAPPTENDTKSYIAHVSRILGVPANQPLDMNSPYTLQALTTAILTKEQGPRLFAAPPATATLPPKMRDQLIADKAKGGQFGPPHEVTGPDGKPMLVVQNKNTGFMHDANTQLPVSVAGPKLDSATNKEFTSINQQVSTIDGALAAVKKTPDAFGFVRGTATRLGGTAESLAGRSDSPEQTAARSYVFNIVSKVINERAGAAQSAQELARLRGFLPAEQDNAKQITNKLNGFKQYLADLQRGTTQGRVVPPSSGDGKPGMVPPPGAVVRIN